MKGKRSNQLSHLSGRPLNGTEHFCFGHIAVPPFQRSSRIYICNGMPQCTKFASLYKRQRPDPGGGIPYIRTQPPTTGILLQRRLHLYLKGLSLPQTGKKAACFPHMSLKVCSVLYFLSVYCQNGIPFLKSCAAGRRESPILCFYAGKTDYLHALCMQNYSQCFPSQRYQCACCGLLNRSQGYDTKQ